jgi:hypothetical protein
MILGAIDLRQDHPYFLKLSTTPCLGIISYQQQYNYVAKYDGQYGVFRRAIAKGKFARNVLWKAGRQPGVRTKLQGNNNGCFYIVARWDRKVIF